MMLIRFPGDPEKPEIFLVHSSVLGAALAGNEVRDGSSTSASGVGMLIPVDGL